MQSGRKLIGLLLAAAIPFVHAQQTSKDSDALKARVGELHSRSSDVKVTLSDGTVVRGAILRVDADAFTVRQPKNAGERSLQYSQVKEVRKNGLSRGTKAVLIPAAIGGGALLVLCAAPYPIGFLCRKDPS